MANSEEDSIGKNHARVQFASDKILHGIANFKEAEDCKHIDELIVKLGALQKVELNVAVQWMQWLDLTQYDPQTSLELEISQSALEV